MNDLPNDVLYEIFLYLPFDLFAIRLVNKRWNHVSQSDKIHQLLFLNLPQEIQQMFPQILDSIPSLYRYKKNVYLREGYPQLHTLTIDMTILNFSNNLSVIPPEIGRLKNVVLLDLFKNKLVSLPREIGQLTNLCYLNLHNNQLVSLPAEIGQLINLQRLDLNTNKLISLPLEIGKLVNLKYLDLEENELVSLPPEIGQLINLFFLDLRNNKKLVSLPLEINQLTSLHMYSRIFIQSFSNKRK